MKSKWLSRKLAVAIIAVVAIALGIHKGDPDAEKLVMEKGVELVDVVVGGVASVYILGQSLVDAFMAKNNKK